MAHITANTDKIFRCVNCGSKNANIVREASTLDATKLKCSDCGFLYTAADSKELEDKEALPDGPPKIKKSVESVQSENAKSSRTEPRLDRSTYDSRDISVAGSLPRTPAYIFISKDRTKSEICSRRDFKLVALRWEYLKEKYDVFELLPKKINTKIDIQ